MVRRTYRCAQCGYEEEILQDITSSPLSICPVTSCGAPSLRQVYAPSSFLVRGSAGERRFRREFVGRERDGSETVYRTLEQAERGERERAEGALGGGLPSDVKERLVRKNLARIRSDNGLLPGTRAAQVCEAIEEQTRGG